MAQTDRKAQKRRLERAGYVFHSGWLPAGNPQGKRFDNQVAVHREDVGRIAAQPSGPRGRPRKSA